MYISHYFLYTLTNTLVVFLILYLFFEKKIPFFLNIEIVLWLGVCLIVVSKSYIIVVNYELNVDESIFLSNAHTLYKTKDIYWKDVDGTTSGPLQTLLPYLYFCLKFPTDWRTGHFIGTLITAFSWFFYAKSILLFYKEKPKFYTILSILFPLLLITVVINHVHNQYSSERLPVLLLLIAIFCIVSKRYYLAGVAIFMACFTKLMVLPIAFGICLIFFVENFRERKEAILKLGLGSLFSVILTLSYLYYYDLIEGAYFFYIKRNIAYSSPDIWFMSMYRYFLNLNIGGSNEIAFINILIIGYTLLVLVLNIRKITKIQIRVITYLLICIILTLYSIFKSGRNSDHYFVLTIFPIFFSFSFVFNNIEWNSKFLIYTFIFLVVMVYFVRIPNVLMKNKLDGYVEFEKIENYKKEYQIANFISNDIKKNNYDKSKIRLKVWGWGGSLHLLTDLPQSTPNNSIDYEIFSSPQTIMESRKISFKYIQDNKPAYFVVKLGQNFGFDLANTIKNTQPELYEYVTTNYVKMLDNNNGIIIYKWSKL